MSETTLPALVGKNATGGTVLRAPKVGLFSDPPEPGLLVEPGSAIGTMTQVSRRFVLVVPPGVSGRVVIAGRAQDALPVEYGETLFAISPFEGVSPAAGADAADTAVPTAGTLSILAPTDGVFYRAPSLEAKPYVAVGDRIGAGRPVGLIEVMKTFNPIAYGGAGFPDEAEIVAVLVADAEEVRAGQALVTVKRL
jgi:acetyl-CoA carboxylase biotin carboxyl carrier protein